LLPIAPPSGFPRNPNVLLIRTHPNPAPSVANSYQFSPIPASLSVSPGIEPGYISFPSQNIMYIFVWHAVIIDKIKEISSSVPGLSVSR
jgi:hypothetical protein